MDDIDDIVVHYIYTSYSQETQDSIKFSLQLLDEFRYTEHFDKLLDLVMSRDKLDNDTIHAGVYGVIHSSIREILTQHGILTKADTKLYYLNSILSSLSIIVDTEDYTREMRIVYSDDDVDSKFIRLIQLCSTMTEIEICDCVEEVKVAFIERLKLFFEQKDDSDYEEPEINEDKIKTVYQFSKMVNKTTLLGRMFLEAGFNPNKPFKNYIPFIATELNEMSMEEIAESIYSLIILSSDYRGSGYQVFKENSDLLISDTAHSLKFLDAIGKLDTLFDNYLKKVRNEGDE